MGCIGILLCFMMTDLTTETVHANVANGKMNDFHLFVIKEQKG